ncbi:unnamed protein product [Ixodes persulcatus]
MKKGSKKRKGKKKWGSKKKPFPQIAPSKELPPAGFDFGMKKKTKKKKSKERVKKKMKRHSGDVPFPEALPVGAPPPGDPLAEPEADTARRKGSTKTKDVGIPLPPEPQSFYSSPLAPSGKAPTAETELTIPKRKTKSKKKKSKMSKTNRMEALPGDGVPPQELFPGAPLAEHPTAGTEMAQEHYARRSKKKKRGSKEKKDGSSSASSPLARLGKFFRLKSDPALDRDMATQALGSAEESKKVKRKRKKSTKGGADLEPLSPEEAILQQAIIDQGLPAATLPVQVPPDDIGADVVEVGVEKKTKKKKKQNKNKELAESIPAKEIALVDEESQQKEKKKRKKKKGDSTPGEGTPSEASSDELSSSSETFCGEEKKSKPKKTIASIEPEVLDARAAEKNRKSRKSKAAPLEHARLVPTSSICSACGLRSTSTPSTGTTVYITPCSTPTTDQTTPAPEALNFILNAITKYCERASKTCNLSATDLNFTIVGPSPLGPPGSTVRVIRGDNSLAQMTENSVSGQPARDIHATRSTISIPSREGRGTSGRKKRAIQRRFIDMMPGTQSTINIPPRKGSVVINVSYPEQPIVPDMTPVESGVSFLPPSRSYSCSRAPACPNSTYCDDETILSGHPPYNNSSRSYCHTESSEYSCDCGQSFSVDESAFSEYPPDRYHLPSEVLREEFSLLPQCQVVPKNASQAKKKRKQIKLGRPISRHIHELHKVLQQPQLTLQPPEQQQRPPTQQPQQLPSPLWLQVKGALPQEQQKLPGQILQTQPFPQVQPQQYGQERMTVPKGEPQWQQIILQSSLHPQETLLQQPGPQSQTLPQYLSNAAPLFLTARQQGPHFQFPAMSQQQQLQLPTQIPGKAPEYALPQVRYQRQPPFDQQNMLEHQQELRQELQKQVALLPYQQQQQGQIPQQQGWPQKRSKILLIHQQLQPDEYLESIAVDGQPIYNQIDPTPGAMQQLPQHLQPGSPQLAPKMQSPPAHIQQFQPLLVPMQYPPIPLQRP